MFNKLVMCFLYETSFGHEFILKRTFLSKRLLSRDDNEHAIPNRKKYIEMLCHVHVIYYIKFCQGGGSGLKNKMQLALT